MKQLAPFDSFKAEVEKLKATAETLTVTDIADRKGMALARATRLALKEVRVSINHRAKELKEDVLRESQRLDSGKRELLALIEPLEARMLECEEFAERDAIRIEDEKRVSRHAEIIPFLTGPVAVDLGKLSDNDWTQMLLSFREAHEARVASAAKAEADRIAREKAEAEDRARIRLENEKLKKEAEEREALAKKERAEAAERLTIEREKAERERAEARLRAEAEATQIRKEATARLEAEAKKARAAAEKARQEREALEAAAKQEREARERLEATESARKLAEERAALELHKAEQKALAAPDAEKLRGFATTLRGLHVPLPKTENGIAVAVELSGKLESLAAWIAAKAQSL